MGLGCGLPPKWGSCRLAPAWGCWGGRPGAVGRVGRRARRSASSSAVKSFPPVLSLHCGVPSRVLLFFSAGPMPRQGPPTPSLCREGPRGLLPRANTVPSSPVRAASQAGGPTARIPPCPTGSRLFVMTKSWEWGESLHHNSGDPVAPASRHGLSQALLHRSDPTGCLYFTPVPQNLWSSYPFLVGRDIINIVSYSIVCRSGNHFSRILGGGLEYILTKSLRGILSSQGPPGGSVITQGAGPAPYELPHPASTSVHSFTICCPLGAPGPPETPTCGIFAQIRKQACRCLPLFWCRLPLPRKPFISFLALSWKT